MIVTDDMGNKNNLLEAPTLEELELSRQDEAHEDNVQHETNGVHPSGEDKTIENDTQHDANDLGQRVQPLPRVEALKLSGKADRSGTSTPEYARTAAEVAESAAWIDPATPEPEVSDEVAGEVGYRQMTSTPPQEAADTAAEVADAAKSLDINEVSH